MKTSTSNVRRTCSEKKWPGPMPFLLKRICIVFALAVPLCFLACNKKDIAELAPEESGQPGSMQAASTQVASTSTVPNFTIVVIPDTQHYLSNIAGGRLAMFTAEINWIKSNKTSKNIVYVLGVGDINQYGDREPSEWVDAKNGYYSLEASNIPYGLAVGNHDQWPQDYPLTGATNEYNRWFGVSHFSSKPYYGGHYGGNNDSHYDLFTASGQDFIVIYIEYDKNNEDRTNMNTWAYDLLGTYSSRKAIIVTHFLMNRGNQGSFSSQGQGIYDRVKSRPNVFMMIGGHISGSGPSDGEGYREDVYNGNTIRSYLVDYQGYDIIGKGGYLRYLEFSIDANDVRHQTYSPHLAQEERDEDSYFTKPLLGPPTANVLANGKYKMLARHTGKAVTVRGASLTDNAEVIQYTYSPNAGTDNDEWNFVSLGNGWYKILNAHSGKAMVVDQAATAWGTRLIQYTYSANATYNDEWGLYDVGSGYYKIINRRTGLCVKVVGTANYDPCVQTGYKLVPEEQFQITLAP